jgi:hypothetical protein
VSIHSFLYKLPSLDDGKSAEIATEIALPTLHSPAHERFANICGEHHCGDGKLAKPLQIKLILPQFTFYASKAMIPGLELDRAQRDKYGSNCPD